MRTLKVGIAKQGRAGAIGGKGVDVWFPSTESFARILCADNRAMLALIAQTSPGSLDDLVELTGRAKSNLSRTLKLLAGYGIVRLERRGRKVAPKLLCDRIELILPLVGRRDGAAGDHQ